MNTDFPALQYLPLVGSQNRGGLSTPPDFDYVLSNQGGIIASSSEEELPEEYFTLKDAAERGDLDLVKTICETDRLPNSAMERLGNERLNSVLHGAVREGRTPVAAYLLSQGFPFETVQIEIALMDGLDSLLYVLGSLRSCRWILPLQKSLSLSLYI
jgi:hypothetical protein